MNLSQVLIVVVLCLALHAHGQSSTRPSTRSGSWEASDEIVESESARAKDALFHESRVPRYDLPDLLTCIDGSRITDRAGWETRRRAEILDLFRTHVYGRAPEPTKVSFELLPDEPFMDGKAVLRYVRIRVEVQEKQYEFPAAVVIPKAARPVPTFLLMNHRGWEGADPKNRETHDFFPVEKLVEQGFAAAVFSAQDVSPDDKIEPPTSGVRAVLASGGKTGEDAWGTIAAWAWGASRVADFLVTNPELDAKKLAIIGHSRGGKTALWAGVQDPRFTFVISNNSGCTGAALARRCFGESVGRINTSFPHWFCGNYKKFNQREHELPVDQHQLLALIAPRALYVASADEDLWADPRGEFLSLVHAAPVYALYGGETFKDQQMPPLDEPIVRGKCAYHIRQGKHGLMEYDWQRYLDFAAQLWGK